MFHAIQLSGDFREWFFSISLPHYILTLNYWPKFSTSQLEVPKAFFLKHRWHLSGFGTHITKLIIEEPPKMAG